jgi:hypothetical protein
VIFLPLWTHCYPFAVYANPPHYCRIVAKTLRREPARTWPSPYGPPCHCDVATTSFSNPFGAAVFPSRFDTRQDATILHRRARRAWPEFCLVLPALGAPAVNDCYANRRAIATPLPASFSNMCTLIPFLPRLLHCYMQCCSREKQKTLNKRLAVLGIVHRKNPNLQPKKGRALGCALQTAFECSNGGIG